MKWIKTNHKGLRYYEHQTRRHGKKKDRYYSIRFKVDRKDYTYGIGWWSDGVPEDVIRNDPDMGFEGYCLSEMKRYKANVRAGSGPISPKEHRKAEEDRRRTEEEEEERRIRENVTFTDYFNNKYAPSMESNGKKSLPAERVIFDKWVSPVIGDLPITELQESHCQQIKKDMQTAGKANRTQHYAFAVVSQIWSMARKEKIVQRDCPTRDVELPRIDNQKKRALTTDEARLLLDKLKAKSRQVYELAYLSLYTGARFGELAGLTWRRINPEEGSITFRNTKSGKDRTVFMTAGVKSLFAEMIPGLPDNLIFSDKKGGRLTSVSNTFDRVVSDLGLNNSLVDQRDKITFHSLRHTHASWLVDSGVNLYVVKEILGHSDFKMTTRYSHPAADSIRKAMKSLERRDQKSAGVVVNFNRG
ncbi:MAG TPA: site-specific integrase [Syntrophales bacterium]|nr:site-specific integrase [Syntrophales bacterium]